MSCHQIFPIFLINEEVEIFLCMWRRRSVTKPVMGEVRPVWYDCIKIVGIHSCIGLCKHVYIGLSAHALLYMTNNNNNDLLEK